MSIPDVGSRIWLRADEANKFPREEVTVLDMDVMPSGIILVVQDADGEIIEVSAEQMEES